MPDKVHEIKIRSNHLLLTLHEIFILVLKYSISLHDACKNKIDFNVGLAEVIAANIQNFRKKKSIQDKANYKKYFYDGRSNFPGGSICSSNRHEFSRRVHLFVEQK